MQYLPLHDQILVELDPINEQTDSGLFRGSVPKTAPKMGRVIAAGPGFKTEDGYLRVPAVKVGDRVLLRPHAGVLIDDGSDIARMILRDQELLCAIKED